MSAYIAQTNCGTENQHCTVSGNLLEVVEEPISLTEAKELCDARNACAGFIVDRNSSDAVGEESSFAKLLYNAGIENRSGSNSDTLYVRSEGALTRLYQQVGVKVANPTSTAIQTIENMSLSDCSQACAEEDTCNSFLRPAGSLYYDQASCILQKVKNDEDYEHVAGGTYDVWMQRQPGIERDEFFLTWSEYLIVALSVIMFVVMASIVWYWYRSRPQKADTTDNHSRTKNSSSRTKNYSSSRTKQSGHSRSRSSKSRLSRAENTQNDIVTAPNVSYPLEE
jgi:hypothetical protein